MNKKPKKINFEKLPTKEEPKMNFVKFTDYYKRKPSFLSIGKDFYLTIPATILSKDLQYAELFIDKKNKCLAIKPSTEKLNEDSVRFMGSKSCGTKRLNLKPILQFCNITGNKLNKRIHFVPSYYEEMILVDLSKI